MAGKGKRIRKDTLFDANTGKMVSISISDKVIIRRVIRPS